MRDEVAPLIQPDDDEASAVRFDALLYRLELAYLLGKKDNRARSDLMKRVSGIAGVANIPEIQAQTDFIQRLLNTDYVEHAGIEELEEKVRELEALVEKLSENEKEPLQTGDSKE